MYVTVTSSFAMIIFLFPAILSVLLIYGKVKNVLQYYKQPTDFIFNRYHLWCISPQHNAGNV